MPLRVGILGLGAIGHLVAAPLLEKPNTELVFYNRSRKDYFLFSPFQGEPLEAIIACETKPCAAELDWLLICLKTYHYPAAAAWFSKLIKHGVKVAVFRNGLDLAAPLLPYTTAEQILPVLVDGPTQYDAATKYYTQLKPGRLTIPDHPLRLGFQDLFSASKLPVNVTFDFKTASWEKLIESAAIGALTCESKQTCRIFQQAVFRQLYIELVQESIQVALADGAQIPDDYLSRMLRRLEAYPPEKGSSMLSDRLAGRPIEVMAKNGIISRKGKELGVATPLNDQYNTLLTSMNR